MPSFDLEPDKFFSQQQWAEIAQTIERDKIPHEAKQRICDALFEYTMATIKPEALNRFVEESRKFRAAASCIQNFLRNFRSHTKIEELIEEIYQVQRFLDKEFKRRPNPKGGCPKSVLRDTLVYRLGLVYRDLTGKEPGLTVNPHNELTGPFPRFTTTIFQFHGIKLAGLKHAIIKARRDIAANAPLLFKSNLMSSPPASKHPVYPGRTAR
jgi:hypothetical protein